MARAMPRELVAAESLQSRLDSGERFGQAQLLALLHGLAETLGEAHRADRFHGRIGPADIRFDEAGEVMLDGWGRDTTPDPVRASRYAAIECYAPVHPQGPWTDIYALGAILWRAITGGPPADVLHRKGDVTLQKLAPSGFDPSFLRTVDAALEIAPQRRPKSIDAWLDMFDARTVGTAAAKSASLAATPVAPRRLSWPVLASAGLAVAVAVAWLGPQPREAPTPGLSTPAPPASSPPPPQATPVVPPVAVPVAVEAAAPAPVPADVPPPEPAPAQPAAEPTASEPMPRVVAADPPPAKAEKPPPAPKPAPQPAPAAPPVAETSEPPGEAPRALLVRADKRLRRLFDDYARLRARVERSYDDPDIPYEVKRRAYREGLRLQKELVDLRAARDRIARTGNFQTANRRFDDLEAAADDVGARMAALRRSI